MTSWSPSNYLKFEEERGLPARDLLARVHLANAKRVVDIGCGPGNSTEFLAERFPDAEILGFDSSATMLEAARVRLPQAKFIEADVTQWVPDGPVDLLYANAVFHWVPDHLSVLARLFESLAPGGVLAVQLPDNLKEPSHYLMREVAEAGPWAARLADAEAALDDVLPPAAYYDRLQPMAARVDVWHTLYNHSLDGPGEIREFLASTGLRPFLAPLDAGEQAAFLDDYERRATLAYPPLVDGRVLLCFPRLFVVAVRA